MDKIISITESKKFQRRLNNLEIICEALRNYTPKNIKAEARVYAKIFHNTSNYNANCDDSNRAG